MVAINEKSVLAGEREERCGRGADVLRQAPKSRLSAGAVHREFTDDDVQSNYGANSVIYCGYSYNPETENYYVRNRYYSPVLGRWISRDPIGVAGGINLYGYVDSSPVGTMDLSGFWTIRRNGKPTATATSQTGDTISDLGKQVHLNGFEWKKWSSVVKGKISGGINDAIKCPLELSIPNLIVIDMGSSVDWNFWLVWPNSIFFHFESEAAKIRNAYKSRGLDVEQNWGATSAQIRSHLADKSKDRRLYGYYFYGHGSGTGVINATRLGGVPPGTYSAYGLAIMFLGACGSLASSPAPVSYILPSGQTVWTSAGTASAWQPNVAMDGQLKGFLSRVDIFTESWYLATLPGL